MYHIRQEIFWGPNGVLLEILSHSALFDKLWILLSNTQSANFAYVSDINQKLHKDSSFTQVH